MPRMLGKRQLGFAIGSSKKVNPMWIILGAMIVILAHTLAFWLKRCNNWLKTRKSNL